MQNSMANSNTTYYNELDDLYRQFERTNNEASKSPKIATKTFKKA